MTKKILMRLALLVLMIIWTPIVNAGYLAAGGSSGGEGGQPGISVETGEFDIDVGDLEILLALGFPIIPYGDTQLPDDTIGSKCPNDDCRVKGTEYKGTEMGGFVKIGVRIFREGCYLNAIGGITTVTESDIVYSPATDRYYEEAKESVSKGLYGIGLSLFSEVFDWQLMFSVDYDNRRGVTGLVGIYW